MTPHPSELSIELISLVSSNASIESIAKWADSARARLNWNASADMDSLLDKLSAMTMAHNLELPSSEILAVAHEMAKCSISD